MSLSQVVNPYTPLVGLTGAGLNGGSLYIGVSGQDPETNPQACFWDAAGTIPATQPISILGGYPMRLGSPALVFTAAGAYSIRVRDPSGVQVFYLASAGGAASTGSQEDVDLLDFIPETEWAAIYAGTSTFDCAPAIRNAIASVTVPVPGLTLNIGGPKVLLPYGVCCVNSTIELKKTVTIQGRSGGGLAWGYGSTLKFPINTTGFIVQRYNTIGTGVQSPATTGADNSVFCNFAMISAGGSDASKHGIWMRARAIVLDVNIESFPGNNINIVATSGGGGALEGNANNWQVQRCRLESARQHGLFVDGADSNAGVGVGIDASANAGWGIYDSSFLGNTYLGCHAASNTTGPYKTDSNNAANVFSGCYSEGGQPGSSLVYPTLVVGGLHGAGFAAGITASVLNTSNGGPAQFNLGVQDSNVVAGVTQVARIGGDVNNGDVLYTSRTMDAPVPWRLHWKSGNLRLDYGNSDGAVTWTVTGQATTRTFGRSVIQPSKMSVDNFFIGPSNNARQHTTAGAAPLVGEWAQGDITWNLNPAASGKIGWVCVTGGTPGTWKAFGVIDP